MDYRTEAPKILRDFLIYHETIKGHSRKTVDEYFLDLRNFFRYIKQSRGLVSKSLDLDEVSIDDVDLKLIRSITLTDIYDYMAYVSRSRLKQANDPSKGTGLGAAARARKIATIRSFFKYLTNKAHLLEDNPMQDLDSPRLKKTLPRYLDLDSSIQLLQSVDGRNRERDYCILTLFLNCGLRISELVGLNLPDLRDDHLRVLGKGNKERIVFLNDACTDAIKTYLAVRNLKGVVDKNACF
jgi:site-specific recombinase XerD